MSLELLFLGTGTSAGVPMIACHCPVCRSSDPRDQRTRPSAVVGYRDSAGGDQRRLLIDAAPELRLQIVRAGLDRIDGLLITHAHADHIFGIDDLRRFNAVMQAPIDLYAEAATMDVLRETFRYIFEPQHNVNQSFVAALTPRDLCVGRPLDLFGARWTPLRLMHGKLPILGFLIEHQGARLAYCTDVSEFPAETWAMLRDLDVLVIDALRYTPHPTHLSLAQALDAIARIQPRAAYLTHIAHDIRHEDLAPKLPAGVFLAHDGLTVTCP